MSRSRTRRIRALALVVPLALATVASPPAAAAPELNGPLPLPLLPPDNWWNLDITNAPVDPGAAAYIAFINNGGMRRLHPDLGGDVSPGSIQNYGFSYLVVDGTQPKKTVQFLYSEESDGVDHVTNTSFPFYPIPDEAITMPHWVEGGEPGNVDRRSVADRHILIVDRDNRDLYELWNCWFDGTAWQAGSGAFFDLDTNARRPDGWTSADAAGLAILPGLIRYDEANGTEEIGHAFRVTVRATAPFYVYPASHSAGSNVQALPMGARLRLKPGVDLSGFNPDVQRIFRAMKRYGLIVADNGSDMYISGTYDNRWDNGVLNPAFRALTASDFEVIELGWSPPAPAVTLLRGVVTRLQPLQPPLPSVLPLVSPRDVYASPLLRGDTDREPVLDPGQPPLHLYALDGSGVVRVVKAPPSVRFEY